MQNGTEKPSGARIDTRPFALNLSAARIRVSLGISLLGLFIFTAGAKPDWFGWDRSPWSASCRSPCS